MRTTGAQGGERPRLAPRGLRGTSLVDHVIEEIRSGRIPLHGVTSPTPSPLPVEYLANLRVADDRRPPPSLMRWLGFEASFFRELISAADPPVLMSKPLAEVVAPPFGELFEHSLGRLLPGVLYPLTTGSDATWALYVGPPDSLGEYPVLELSIADEPTLSLAAPGFDVWLAMRMRMLDLEGRRDLFETSYGPAMSEHARLNLAGHQALWVSDGPTTDD